MKPEYINAFVESICNVFETMLNTSLGRRQLRATSERPERASHGLTSIIGISGGASGVVALSFPRATALALASRFLASEITEVNGEVTDALAELVNMVGGGAKSKFEIEPPPQLSLPTVIEGHSYKMCYPTKSVWFEAPFDSDAGEFLMEVSFGKG